MAKSTCKEKLHLQILQVKRYTLKEEPEEEEHDNTKFKANNDKIIDESEANNQDDEFSYSLIVLSTYDISASKVCYDIRKI